MIRGRRFGLAAAVLVTGALVSLGVRADAPVHGGTVVPDCLLCVEPADAQSFARLAYARLVERDADGSASAIRQALQRAPRCAPYWASLGDALWLGGGGHFARSAWYAALRLDPDDPVARARLGVGVEPGWQTHAVDLAAIGVMAGGLAARKHAPYGASVLLWAGLATYVLGPPIVHFAHGNVWGAAASLLLRLPVLGLGLAIGEPLARSEARLVVALFGAALFVVDVLEVAVIGRARAELPRWPIRR